MMNKNFIGSIFILSFATYGYASDVNKPNILIIQCDQQRYDCLGYTGNRIVSTPNIDALAESGIQFRNAYTPIPTSCPARQCLLSGLWPEQHGGLWNYDITLPLLLFDKDTWTEKLHEKGYSLGYVGKWHVHPKKTPIDFGFDDYVYVKDYQAWLKEQNKALVKVPNIKDNIMMGGYSNLNKEDASIHWFAKKAIELIKKYESEGKPWHIRLDYVEPHLPSFPVKEYYDLYKDKSIPAWENFSEDFKCKPYIQRQQVFNWGIEDYTWGQWEKYMRSYYAVITQLDDAIGYIIRELIDMGIIDNTMIIYTADHGDAAGSHRMLDKHYVMYEEEVHVPLIIRWDSVVKSGTYSDNFVVHALDLAATISDILDLGHSTQGLSLYPILKGENPKNWRRYAFSNYNGQQFGLFVQRMIRDERYKYIWNPTDIDEFYDMLNDPFEKHNAINDEQYKDVIMRLRKDLYFDLINRNDPIAGHPSAAKKQLLQNKKQTIR